MQANHLRVGGGPCITLGCLASTRRINERGPPPEEATASATRASGRAKISLCVDTGQRDDARARSALLRRFTVHGRTHRFIRVAVRVAVKTASG